MKSIVAAVALLSLFCTAAGEPATKPKKKRSSVPGPYPANIQIPPPGTSGADRSQALIQSELGGRDMQFLQAASRIGREQLALAELARSKGASDQVVLVAETIASTQATESKEISRLAEAKRVTLPSAVPPVGELGGLSGAKFEKAWVERLISINEASVAAYEGGSKSQDAAIRGFAEKMLPAAQARLQVARRLGGRPVAAPGSGPPADEATPRPIPPPVSLPAEKEAQKVPARR